MLKIISLVSLLVFSQLSYSEELTDEKKQIIDEMLDITGALKIGEMMGNAAAGQMINALRAQSKNIDEKAANVIKDEMGKLMHEEFIANGFINNMSHGIYHKYFTLAELKEIVGFYKTTTGAKMASLLPKITQEGMMEGQKHGMSLGPKINQRIQARLVKEGISLN
ncbi:DUF2059 domain-containing protein [Paraglaciecola aquimarina]|uniref:DUF2059 domain-containing protein n=1 Tax=Paraglaciecola algarum TaxID=3050085 RepID=A0ABS9D490_9ALTE|nr:DUF2059 domain-containing protein [Paraglaciecola sp. G1-23]MCF2947706.1 DUF2059 domain-containing protein [Paraglaciecola sp. G1-23]